MPLVTYNQGRCCLLLLAEHENAGHAEHERDDHDQQELVLAELLGQMDPDGLVAESVTHRDVTGVLQAVFSHKKPPFMI